MLLRIWLVLSLLVAGTFSFAAPKGNSDVTGRGQIGVAVANGVYKNLARAMCPNASLLTSTPNWPSVLDTYGYPNNGGPPGTFVCQVGIPSDVDNTTTMVVGWQGTGAIYINTGSPGITVTSANGATTSSDCGSLTTLPKVCAFGGTFRGTDVRFTFTFNNANISVGAGPPINFPAGQTYSGMTGLYVAKLSDEAAILSETNPEDVVSDSFIEFIKQANPKVIRSLGLINVNNGNNVTSWEHRPNWKLAANYSPRWEPTLWAGQITNTSDVLTVAAPPGFSGLIDGATIQGYVTVTNATGYPTLNVGGTGAKRIANSYGGYPSYTVGGSPTIGDTLDVIINSPLLPGGTATVSYVTSSASTSTTAQNLAAAVNANSTVTGAGFYASYVSGSSFNLILPPGPPPTYTASVTGTATLTAGNQIGIGAITANIPNTYIYDAALDLWIYTTDAGSASGGMRYQMPIEVVVGIANRVNKHLWIPIPGHATDAWVASACSYVAANLKKNLKFYIEFSNEIWNNGAAFDQTSWATARGMRLGFPAANNETLYGFYALRSKQIFDICKPILGDQLKRTLMVQAAGPDGGANTYRFQGADLRNSLLSPGGQNFYQQFVGVDYNVSPNRPIDSTETIGYADYMGGGQITNQFVAVTAPANVGGPNTYTSIVDGSTFNNTTFGGWAEAAANYESGDPQLISNALQFMDWDVRRGIKPSRAVTSITSSGCATVTASSNHGMGSGWPVAFNTTGTFDAAITKGKNYFVISSGLTLTQFQFSETLNGSCVTVSGASSGTITFGTIGGETFDAITTYSARYYPKWQAIASSYNGGANGRPAEMPNVEVELYEGSYEVWYPPASTCTNLSLPSSYCGSTGTVAQMIYAYKMSPLFYQFQVDHFNACYAMANTTTCTWFQSNGPNQWSILSGDYAGFVSGNGRSNAFQSFQAFQKFNLNFLLKRDLDPASNDNDPMWLEKAA